MQLDTISLDLQWMGKLESRLDCFEAAKNLTDEHLQFREDDMKCTTIAIQELLSIMKCNGVEN